MHERLLAGFGAPAERVEKALAALRAGRGVLVTDDEKQRSRSIFIARAMSFL